MDKLPSAIHEEKFLMKLRLRTKKYIDLTPYFIKLAIVTIIVFLCSILVWNFLIRKNKDELKKLIVSIERPASAEACV